MVTAARLCRDVLTRDPHHLQALFGLASIEFARGDLVAAEALAARVLALDGAIGDAHNLRATALAGLGRREEAAESFGRAARLLRDPAAAYYNEGTLLHELGRLDEALRCYDAALRCEPRDAIAHNNRGNALRALNRPDEAIAAYDRALAVEPNYADAWSNRGIALQCLERASDALASYDRALALAPNLAAAHYNRGITLGKLGWLEEARASYDRAVAVQPDHTDAASAAFAASALLCDWRDRGARERDLMTRLAAGQRVAPFVLLGFCDDPARQAQAAMASAASLAPAPPAVAAQVRSDDTRIRVVYLSADFRNHVVGHTLADLFEQHDHARFELFGVSLTSAPDSAIRRRLAKAFDHFIDAARLSDGEVAALLREHDIDIAVDLMGHTEGSRLAIFAHRAAPLQVNYFGYPGTSGADFIDYLIADRTVITTENRSGFHERIVTLPDCYLPFDPAAIATGQTRAALGLPENGFVFCNFNASYKITPDIFAIWMRLLTQVENSVLWLYAGPAAQAHLRREAEAREIDPARLVFAAPVERAAHVARLRCADLFLDTLPYNAHNTAIEALAAGLPLVTCSGRSFAARVATSVLDAAGLPELVTASLAEYEVLASTLSREPAQLAALRAKLASARNAAVLFDTDRYRRHLEIAYMTMWERQRRGEAPQDFAVPPLQ